MKRWVIVDDSLEESAVLAGLLAQEGVLEVSVISASQAQEKLENLSLAADGILMDVDLSNEAGLRFTGPGLAQSIRVAQRREVLPSIPVVRFAARERIRESIGSDSSSDDVFDLKVEKDDLGDGQKGDNARRQLLALG